MNTDWLDPEHHFPDQVLHSPLTITTYPTTSNQHKLISLSDQPAFDLIVIGSGGGPFEDNLSSYFLKSKRQRWKDGFTALEAGSGFGALTRLLDTPSTLNGHEHGPFWDFDLPTCTTPTDASSMSTPSSAGSCPTYPNSRLAGTIYSSLTSFCITHAHLDHIAALVLTAGALAHTPKTVWASPETVESLLTVFAGGLWPHLADRTGNLPLWLRNLDLGLHTPVTICPSLTLQAWPIAHGLITDSGYTCASVTNSPPLNIRMVQNQTVYHSTAFFITDEPTDQTFLFFGDLGPDSVTGVNLNQNVWKHAFPKFLAGKLKTIFIECSYDSSRSSKLLYGHLSPPYLFEELNYFANLIDTTSSGQLTGLNVVLIHVKDEAKPLDPTQAPEAPVRKRILDEILELEATKFKLGCRFVMVEQGERLEF
ncbi:hypothetical protein CROQUDRAFT_62192 [Cronartium quercuum f. sp. fusiforme G11]|uniref:3',5'-cyclic-nucleotide phosphodiesterase n=1 Tax=Cronartium quercuum f. sp. fusiforme G11 TaxID=708437 RepID=A0A9P6TC56_9BASI|nr:hypothetical protein CROQUDRAFT_62192 [Cronartium quercuum f. sp. fusiforme G11]